MTLVEILLVVAGLGALAAALAWRRAAAGRAAAERRAEVLLQATPDAIVGVDAAGQILFVNRQVAALLGYFQAELAGQPLASLLAEPEAAAYADFLRAALQAPGYGQPSDRRPLMARHRDGRRVPLEVGLQTLATPVGRMGIVALRDLSAQKQAADQLRLQSVALESAANGIVITSRAGEIEWTNPAFTRMTGYTAAEARGQTPRLLKSGRHPPEFYRSIWDAVIAGQVWQGETINRRKDGSLYVEEQTVAPVRDEAGQITHFVAIKQDITARKQAEAAAARRTRDLAALADTMLDLSQRRDVDDILESIVRRASQLLDTTNAFLDLVGPDQDRLQPRVAIGGLRQSLSYPVRPGEGVAGVVWQTGQPLVIRDYDTWAGRVAGIDRNVLGALAGAPLKAGDRILGVLGVAYDASSRRAFTDDDVAILTQFAQLAAVALDNAQLYATAQRELAERTWAETELRQTNGQLSARLADIEALQAQLREQAIRDPLTGLFNRRYLGELLDRELARATRLNAPLSVVVLDVDHFKRVNDTYGHKAGDLVLQSLAGLLMASTRQEDFPCRYGGEEFVLVLVGAPPQAAYQRAEAWRAAFAGKAVAYESWNIATTISLGVAGYPQHGVTADELLKAADRALYQAKARGRNQVMVAEARPTAPLTRTRAAPPGASP